MQADKRFGEWLRQRRRALDLTQAELAQRVGCALVTVKKIERGAQRPSKQMTARLATVLAIQPSDQAAFVALARGISAPSFNAIESGADLAPGVTWQPVVLEGCDQELVRLQCLLANKAGHLLMPIWNSRLYVNHPAQQAAQPAATTNPTVVYLVSLAALNAPETFVLALVGLDLSLNLGVERCDSSSTVE